MEIIELNIGDYGFIHFKPPSAMLLKRVTKAGNDESLAGDALLTGAILECWVEPDGKPFWKREVDWLSFLESQEVGFYTALLEALTPYLNVDPSREAPGTQKIES